MHRLKLKKLLQNYYPIDSEEIIFKDQILTFVENNPDCFKRTLEIGHITASAWLQSKDGSKVLLLLHAKLQMWLQGIS